VFTVSWEKHLNVTHINFTLQTINGGPFRDYIGVSVS
jgi:hypothetical protein